MLSSLLILREMFNELGFVSAKSKITVLHEKETKSIITIMHNKATLIGFR